MIPNDLNLKDYHYYFNEYKDTGTGVSEYCISQFGIHNVLDPGELSDCTVLLDLWTTSDFIGHHINVEPGADTEGLTIIEDLGKEINIEEAIEQIKLKYPEYFI